MEPFLRLLSFLSLTDVNAEVCVSCVHVNRPVRHEGTRETKAGEDLGGLFGAKGLWKRADVTGRGWLERAAPQAPSDREGVAERLE